MSDPDHPIPWHECVCNPLSIYLIISTLGVGSTSNVYSVIHRESGHQMALKQIKLHDLKEMELLRNEFLLMTQIHHPNLCSCSGAYVWQDEVTSIYSVSFALQLYDASLGDVIGAAGALPEDALAEVTVLVLRALAHLHARRVLHRDVKAANVLVAGRDSVGEGAQLALADLGVSATLGAERSRARTFVGTPVYLAPEVIRGEPYDEAVDMWSLGIMIIELIDGVVPHGDRNPLTALFLIANAAAPPTALFASQHMQDIIAKLLVFDPRGRISAEALLQHPFLIDAAGRVDAAGGTSSPALAAVLDDCMSTILEKRAQKLAETTGKIEGEPHSIPAGGENVYAKTSTSSSIQLGATFREYAIP